jgi:putative Holliday junction resolvase
MTAILGIDLGERRIGIAIADAPGAGARPLSTIRRGRDIATDLSALRSLIDANSVGEVVVGLPIDAGGHESEQAARTRAWVEAIRRGLAAEVMVAFQDERLTSHVAETRLGPMPRGRSGGPPSRQQRDAYRARVDREAAAIILQDFLDSRGALSTTPIRPTMEPRP